MIWVDFVIIGIIALSAVISLLRGFVREAMSLTVWLLACWVAWSFFRELAVHLDWIAVPSLRLGAAMAMLFVATLIVGGLVNFLVGQLVDKTGLTGTDRLIGVLFGAARGILLVTLLIFLSGLTPLPHDPWWQTSQLIPYFQELATWLTSLLPEDLAERFNLV